MSVVHGAAEAFVEFMDSGPPLYVSLVLFFVVGIPLVLLHELGHASAARLILGGRVEVTVGGYGQLVDVELGALRMRLNGIVPLAGVAGTAVFDDSRARADDILLIALAGPAASLLGTILTAWLLSGTAAGSMVHAVLWSATGAGAMLTIVNLVPMELLERSGNRWRTDGRVALDALRLARRWH
jgi:membrane-associated protease RseP (regulator of RpoE activity)